MINYLDFKNFVKCIILVGKGFLVNTSKHFSPFKNPFKQTPIKTKTNVKFHQISQLGL